MYKFQFQHSEIEDYFYSKVYDPLRMSVEQCKEEGLPYIDPISGLIKNTHKFQETAGAIYNETRNYPQHPYMSKAYFDYWNEEKRRCKEGIWLGQIRITGDYYYFLNFHLMKMGSRDNREITGVGLFRLHQFNFFHIYEYARFSKQNLALIKPRGCGLSEAAASLAENVIYNPYVDPISKEPEFNSVKAYAYDKDFLSGEGKLFDLVHKNTEWITEKEPEGHGFFKNFEHTKRIPDMYLVAGDIEGGGKGKKKQTGGSFECISVQKADKVRGGRTYLIAVEEAGACPILGSMLQKMIPNTWRYGAKTGLLLIWGTSNADSRGIEAFKSVLQNPLLSECVSFKNVWANMNDKSKEDELRELPLYAFEYMLHPSQTDQNGVGWFIPYYDSINNFDYYDDDGNVDRIAAWKFILETRRKKLELAMGGSAEQDVLEFIADHPITMEEAFFTSKGKRFSSDELIKQIVNLETGMYDDVKVERGDLHFVYDKMGTSQERIVGVDFIPSKKGAFRILHHPEWAVQMDKGRRVLLSTAKQWRLYLGGIDGIDQGTEESSGKGSNMACVIKRRTDKYTNPFSNAYVAYYNNRSKAVKADHENTLKLLMYYHAEALLEFAKITVQKYIMNEMKMPLYLAVEPERPGEAIANYKRKKRKKGIRITKDIINYGNNLIEDYIISNYQKLYFSEMLNELNGYSDEDKGKFDIIAAMRMCEILCEEHRDRNPINTEVNNDKYEKLGTMRWYTDARGRRQFGVPPKKEYLHKQNRPIDYIDHQSGKIIYR